MTQKQIDEVKRIISEHINEIIYLATGNGTPSPSLAKKLNLPKEFIDLITTTFKYGKFNMVDRKFSQTLSSTELDKILKNITLTNTQVKALEYTKISTGQNITGLGSKITSSIVPALATSGLSQLQGVQTIVGAAILDTSTRYTVVQNLRDMSGDWDRDWHRVAHTEMWNAKINGEVMAMMEDNSALSGKKGDTIVFKQPSPMACNQCRKLYLKADGVTPKLFKLSEMLELGSNVGLKTADWKPVVGTVHPNCMCPLLVMPDGFTFDKNGDIVPIRQNEVKHE